MPIPKIIHYCWFGGNPKPELAEKCIASWKKYCPDYEIVEWNETNYDVNCNQYSSESYTAKKYAFVTDIARLNILYQHGGIYLDTDVELLRSPDALLENDCFMGIENSTMRTKVNTGMFLGSVPGFPLIKEFLDDYDGKHFFNEDGSINLMTCTERNTAVLLRHGYVEQNKTQQVAGAVVYATDYFSPMLKETGIIYKTQNTYSIHHYALSWMDEDYRKHREKWTEEARRKTRMHDIKKAPNRILKTLLGEKTYENLKNKLK